jgi:hypothetical protein
MKLRDLTCLLALALPMAAAPNIKVIKLAVTNLGALPRPAANVAVPLALLRQAAPDFQASAAIVTLASEENQLPSQADDPDGDGELCFQMDLGPHETRTVSISYGGAATRRPYPRRTQALFSQHYEGPGWESELNAWRIYFDARNAIDLWGKRRPGLYLEMFAEPGYDYHAESPLARDIYKVGDAIGIGAVAARVEGRTERVSQVAGREWKILANGPVRSVVELRYRGWRVGGRQVDLVSRFTQWAGERGFEHRITVAGAAGLELVTGLPRKPGVPEVGAKLRGPALGALATWGPQVLEPGAQATEALKDQNLGLVLLAPGAGEPAAGDALNYLLPLHLRDGSATWFVAAAWDQEGTITTLPAFLEFAAELKDRALAPVTLRLVTSNAQN